MLKIFYDADKTRAIVMQLVIFKELVSHVREINYSG